MNTLNNWSITLFVTFCLSLSVIPDAEAKRFGGARSFGSKPSFSRAYRGPTSGAQRTARQQQAQSQNNKIRNRLAGRGSMMGMLGGLALGGLLGSLFFGGAFQGINFFDFLILGGIAFLLYRWFAAKSQHTAQSTNGHQSSYGSNAYYQNTSDFEPNSKQPNQAKFNTDVMFGKSAMAKPTPNDAEFDSSSLPSNFDEQGFLDGAKEAFNRLQAAWDQKDLVYIRGLTTDHVFAEIQNQIKASSESNQTNVLKINAELLEVREVGEQIEAVVLFDTVLRENMTEQAQQVKEIWHFIKPINSFQTTWFLDGIQQLEN